MAYQKKTKKVKQKPFDGFGPKEKKNARNALRLVWQRSHARKLVIKRCTGKDGFPRCEKCKKKTPVVKVDHIKRIGEMDSGFISRLFVPSKDLQGLCPPCHQKKTNSENSVLKWGF